MKALLIRDGRLLLVREAEGEQYWELPGGRIEVGEETSSQFRWMTRSECDSVHLAPGYAAPLEQFWRATSASSP